MTGFNTIVAPAWTLATSIVSDAFTEADPQASRNERPNHTADLLALLHIAPPGPAHTRAKIVANLPHLIRTVISRQHASAIVRAIHTQRRRPAAFSPR